MAEAEEWARGGALAADALAPHVGLAARTKVWLAHRLPGRVQWRQDVRVGARTLRVPLSGSRGADLLRPFEPYLDPLLHRVLGRRAGALLDVGANMGHFFLKQRGLGHAGPYLGIEPNPELAAYLQALLALNLRPGEEARVVACGLGEAAGAADLLVNGPFASGSSLVEGFRPDSFYAWRQCVPVLTGDRVLADLRIGPLALVKIDVEGGELEVCRGLAARLAAEGPPLLVEVLPADGLGRTEPLPASTVALRRQRNGALNALLAELGYAFLQVLPDGSWRPAAALSHAPVTRLEEATFLAIRPEERARLRL